MNVKQTYQGDAGVFVTFEGKTEAVKSENRPVHPALNDKRPEALLTTKWLTTRCKTPALVPSGRQKITHHANCGQTWSHKSFHSPERDDRPSRTVRMDSLDLHMAYLTNADNRVSARSLSLYTSVLGWLSYAAKTLKRRVGVGRAVRCAPLSMCARKRQRAEDYPP